MKKLLAILCAVMLVLTCSISVFAAGDGSITITNAVEGKTYNAYKMLDLTKDGELYKYTVDSDWADFFTTGAGKDYVNIVDNIVTWKGGADVAALAKAAIAYAKANSISADGTESYPDDLDGNKNEIGSVQFTALDLGYYLVDSNLGSICAIDTTNKDAEIEEKNKIPSVDKVLVDSDGSAKIGDTIKFKSTITAYKGIDTLTWYDKMSDGLTYTVDSIAISVVGGGTLTKDTDYTVETNKDGFDIIVKFDSAYLNSIDEDTNIEITYSAVLNENAASSGGADNTVHITYGDDNIIESGKVLVDVNTFSFDLAKTDSNDKLLANAGFRIYSNDSCDPATEIELVKIDDYTYRVAKEGEEDAGAEIMSKADKPITILGLDFEVTYYLKETTTPANYNPLSAPKAFEIQSIPNTTVTMDALDPTIYQSGGVQIINNSGSLLPETGGMGTTLFIAIGAIVVLVTGVILVARKRMSKYVA